ncbi:MAG: FIST C-terminal domain-containing protein [Alphaproteobacteria bacterium]|nr:FIST C-terminal domain-containing protein [Alphaproteobacteria bacterium]
MSLFTSTQFASAAACGTDWRDTSKNILEKLEAVRTENDKFNFGFLYISDHLADDAGSILNLFRSVMHIDNWIGSVGMGIVGCGEAYIDQPAVSALIGRFPEEDFCIFPKVHVDGAFGRGDQDGKENTQQAIKDWLGANDPMLTFVHCDPMAEDDPIPTLQELERVTGGFIVGGLTSSRGAHIQIANAACENSVSGCFFSQGVNVATMLSQGCEPISDMHTITKADYNVIEELDGHNALEVFQQDLKKIAAERTGHTEKVFEEKLKTIDYPEQAPDEYKTLFKGQIHAAIPVSLSDQKDYMVRNLTGIEPAEGSIAISQPIYAGDRVLFVERGEHSVTSDLSRSLLALRERVQNTYGTFEPKGAIYVSCIARGFSEFQHPKNYEMDLIREIIGSVPLAGFYAGGEINNSRLYSYTGILTLFL